MFALYHPRNAVRRIDGLPFTAASDGNFNRYPMVSVLYRGIQWGASDTSAIAWVNDDTTTISLASQESNASSTFIQVSGLANGDEIYVSGCYITDDD